MKDTLTRYGNLAATLGVLLCLSSSLVRLLGYRYLFGCETLSFFILGIAFLQISIIAKLEAQTV